MGIGKVKTTDPETLKTVASAHHGVTLQVDFLEGFYEAQMCFVSGDCFDDYVHNTNIIDCKRAREFGSHSGWNFCSRLYAR